MCGAGEGAPVRDSAKTSSMPQESPDLRGAVKPGYDLFIIVVTVLSIVNWVFMVIPPSISSETRELLIFMEPIFTVILLLDFGLRLRLAKGARWQYMNRGGGWLDLIGSLPYGRVLRLFRLWTVLTSFQRYGWSNTLRWFVAHRAQGTLFMVLAFLTVILECGGLLVLHFEAGVPGSNIGTGGEALWWGVVTITTVGYGDYFPVTPGGQIVATVMIVSGVALISIFTAWVASTFLAPARTGPVGEGDQTASDDPSAIIADLRDRLDHLEAVVAGKPPSA